MDLFIPRSTIWNTRRQQLSFLSFSVILRIVHEVVKISLCPSKDLEILIHENDTRNFIEDGPIEESYILIEYIHNKIIKS